MSEAVEDISGLFEQLTVRENIMDPAQLEAVIKSAVSAALQCQERSMDRRVQELNAKIHELEIKSAPVKVEVYEEVTIDRSVVCEEGLEVVKSLPEFTGKDYLSFRDAAFRAYRVFEHRVGSVKHYEALSIIRNRIKGEASRKLTSFSTPFNFLAIIARLDHEYGDKRPMHVIEQELSVLRQGNLSVLEYYDEVQKKLTALTNKCLMTEKDRSYAERLNEKFRRDALRVFVSGVRKNISDVLFASKPEDLPTALAMAEELDANRDRFNFALGFNKNDFRDHSNSHNSGARPANPNYMPKFTANKPPTVARSAGPQPMDIDPSLRAVSSKVNGSGWNRGPRQHNQGINHVGADLELEGGYERMAERGLKGALEEEEYDDLDEGARGGAIEEELHFLGATPCCPSFGEE